MLGINYGEVVPVLIKAIQEQQDMIKALHTVNSEYDRRLAALEARLQP